MRQILINIIIEFNIANNLHFADVPDAVSGKDILKYLFLGTEVFIPSKDYLEYALANLGERFSQESKAESEQFKSPEVKEVLEKSPRRKRHSKAFV